MSLLAKDGVSAFTQSKGDERTWGIILSEATFRLDTISRLVGPPTSLLTCSSTAAAELGGGGGGATPGEVGDMAPAELMKLPRCPVGGGGAALLAWRLLCSSNNLAFFASISASIFALSAISQPDMHQNCSTSSNYCELYYTKNPIKMKDRELKKYILVAF